MSNRELIRSPPDPIPVSVLCASVSLWWNSPPRNSGVPLWVTTEGEIEPQRHRDTEGDGIRHARVWMFADRDNGLNGFRVSEGSLRFLSSPPRFAGDAGAAPG